MASKKLLILGHTFPEPTTTAAGARMMQLIAFFQQENYDITFATTAAISEKSFDLKTGQIEIEKIALNDPSFDVFVRHLNPTIVLYDRYITEEQFGWRITSSCPNALQILDTEDLHFLRKAREDAIKNNIPVAEASLYTETAKRELASILRSDLSLIISEVEMTLLLETFKIPESILYYVPFLITPPSEVEKKALPSFEEREHFITIGNFLHAPNVDSVTYLKTEIWPAIRKQLPKAELHVYGTYATQQILQCDSKKEGFLIKGWAPSVKEVMSTARICLAPIRFGAGLKGKFIDAMQYGTPLMTTTIGAEGLFGEEESCGGVADIATNYVNRAVTLYSENRNWQLCHRQGFQILENRFDKKLFLAPLKEKIDTMLNTLESHRKAHFIGQILTHHSLQATKYLSKWIETKNKCK